MAQGGLVGVPPGTTVVQLPDGRVIQFIDSIDDRLYGSVQFATGDVNALDPFSVSMSQQIPGGTRQMNNVDNNLIRSGSQGLSQAWAMSVYSIQLEFARATRVTGSATEPAFDSYSDPVSFVTAFDLNRKIYFQFKYNNKEYLEGMIQDLPGATGLHFQGTQTAIENVHNGPPDVRTGRSLVIPVIMTEQKAFSLQMTPQVALTIAQTAGDANTALSFVDMRAKLVGLIDRNVN